MKNFTKWKLTAAALIFLLLAGGIGNLKAQELFAQQSGRPGKTPLNTDQSGNEKDGKISFRAEGVLLAEILRQVEQQSRYYFVYFDEEVNSGTELTVLFENRTIESLLDELLTPLEIRYKIKGKQIILQKKKLSAEAKSLISTPPNEIAGGTENLNEASTATPVNQRIIFLVKGKVTDELSAGLPGVNVVEKGTTNGTVTDAKGEFSINVEGENATLVFSFIGYAQQEASVNGQTTLNVSLTPDVKSLSEVVVIGYGTQKKSDLTGSVASVNVSDIQKMVSVSVEDALAGRVAGVMVTKGEGSPGSGSKILVRGVGSLGNTDPLWVIDGVISDAGNHLNMQDVESIEVLKDAAASAIYGAKAAHGVIIVSTKRGKAGAPQVRFRSTLGQRSAINLPNMLGTADFLTANIEARKNAGNSFSDFDVDPNTLPNTDWRNLVYGGSGLEQNYLLSVNGGSESANFYLSAGYDKEAGVMINNSFERFSLRVNSDFKIGNKIKLGNSLAVSKTNSDPTSASSRDLESIFRAIPTMPLYDESNRFGGWGRAPSYFQGANPVAVQKQKHQLNAVNRIVGNVYADVEVIQGLNLRASVGGIISSARNQEFQEAYDYGSLSDIVSKLSYSSDDDDNIIGNLVATYNKKFGEKHNFLAMVGYEARTNNSWAFGTRVDDYPVNLTWSQALGTGAVDVTNRNNIGQYRVLSQFARLSYDYAGKYLVQANVRRDGSSNFGANNRWGVFPSISLGWRVSDEQFMTNVSFISNLKLRGSYGINGSDNIDSYLFSKTYWNQRSTYVYDNRGEAGKERGFYLRRFPNADAKWEEVQQTNFGIDLGLFQGKIEIVMDYFTKNTTDMLYSVPLPQSTGISRESSNPDSPKMNIGTLTNKGFEFAANYSEAFGGLIVRVGANASFISNEITKLNNPNDIINAGSGGTAINGNLNRTEINKPMGYFYGYVVEGIFNSKEEVDQANAAAPDGVYWRNETAPGDLKYKDIASRDANGKIIMVPDGKITDADRTDIGNPWPKMVYGININLEYKGFDFTMFFQGSQGNDIFNANKAYYRSIFQDYNTSEKVFERWTPDNMTSHPRLISTDPSANFKTPSSYFVENGSFLKLRNVQLGYTLPSVWMSRVKVKNLRLFVNAQNVFTISGYEGPDPELSGDNTSFGIDGQGQYPQTRYIGGGIEITF